MESFQAEHFKELEKLPPLKKRLRVVESARKLLGTPYYWGGLSAKIPGLRPPPHTAVDCSGLTHLCYRTAGIQIPRDAHEQWMKAMPIAREELLPGDLIFFSDPKDPEKVSHVMLSIGESRVIEGPGTGKHVREIDLDERLKEAEGRRVTFGRVLSS